MDRAMSMVGCVCHQTQCASGAATSPRHFHEINLVERLARSSYPAPCSFCHLSGSLLTCRPFFPTAGEARRRRNRARLLRIASSIQTDVRYDRGTHSIAASCAGLRREARNKSTFSQAAAAASAPQPNQMYFFFNQAVDWYPGACHVTVVERPASGHREGLSCRGVQSRQKGAKRAATRLGRGHPGDVRRLGNILGALCERRGGRRAF